MNEFAMRRQWGPTPKFERVLAYDPPSKEFVTIAGPCSLESESQIEKIAPLVSKNGATHLRSGVFRAGTYPGHSFGYVEERLMQAYQTAAKISRLNNIIEVLDYSEYQMDMVARYCDCFQVGARSMQNYTLLRTLGDYGKPVFLKRNTGSTLDEWLGSAEHLLIGGVKELYLIERGSSTHMNHVRWDLSLSVIPAIKAICKIPVIVDASHGTGRRDLVESMTLAGVAAGAGGILVEVHTDPEKSLSDADQAVSPETFERIMKKVNAVRTAIKGE